MFSGSFLNTNCRRRKSEYFLKVFGVSQFDVIMGNPPYQRSRLKVKKRGLMLEDKHYGINLLPLHLTY